MKFIFDDGGRAAAGFKGTAGDCVVRAVAIASARPYAEVYAALADGMGSQRKSSLEDSMTKTEQHEAIRERARGALRDLYHNATPDYPRDLHGQSEDYFQSWFEDTAQLEIEYLQGGGAYGHNYRKTLAADYNAGKYHSERAQAYYVAKGMRAMQLERADCGALTRWRTLELAAGNKDLARRLQKTYKGATLERNDAQWERIGEFGKLYQYGRGGRTLAPDGLMNHEHIREDYADDLSITDVVDLIRVLESFNRYVAAWCASVPDQWAEHCADLAREKRAEQKRAAAERREEHRRAELRACFC